MEPDFSPRFESARLSTQQVIQEVFKGIEDEITKSVSTLKDVGGRATLDVEQIEGALNAAKEKWVASIRMVFEGAISNLKYKLLELNSKH